MLQGFKDVATRIVAADENFIDSVMEQFGKTKEEAEKVLRVFRKAKVVKRDAVMGRWLLQHGAYWEQEVIDRAAAMPEGRVV